MRVGRPTKGNGTFPLRQAEAALRRHTLRGIGLLVLAGAMTAVTINTIVQGPFGGPPHGW